MSIARQRSWNGVNNVHIFVDGFSEHLLLCWGEGGPARILAKSKKHKRGSATDLKASEFRHYASESVLDVLRDRLGRVELDEPGAEHSWASFREFTDWLRESSRPEPSIWKRFSSLFSSGPAKVG